VTSGPANQVLQGYVFSGPNGQWGTTGAGTHDEDTIYVFQTYAISTTTQVIPLYFDGDDGHSLYVNDVLIGGGGFGAEVYFNLSMTAQVPIKIDIGDYNGPGAMGVELQRQDDTLKIDSTPGVTLNAADNFAAVPEPSAFALLGSGAVVFGVAGGWPWRYGRRARRYWARKCVDQSYGPSRVAWLHRPFLAEIST
jgi:hypothetical protein